MKIATEPFYHRLDHLFSSVPVFSQPFPDLPPVPVGDQSINMGGGEIVGGEVGGEVIIASWLKGFVNYSYQELKGDVSNRPLVVAPRHKVNAGVSVSFPHGLSATVLVHYVGEAKVPTFGDPRIVELNPYTLVNARVGYGFKAWGRDLELSVQAFNLLNDVHREVPGGDLIERRVSGTVRLRF